MTPPHESNRCDTCGAPIEDDVFRCAFCTDTPFMAAALAELLDDDPTPAQMLDAAPLAQKILARAMRP